MIIIFSEVLGYDQYHNPFFYLFNLLYGIKPLITLWYYRRNVYNIYTILFIVELCKYY